jgi:hypothetical protein
MISLLCLVTSEATFFKKRHPEPEYHYMPPEDESLSMDHYNDGECRCECPKDKFIRVEVPKTQIQYFPISEKDLEDTYQEPVEDPEQKADLSPNDIPQDDLPDGKASPDLYQQFEGFVHKLTNTIAPEIEVSPPSEKGKWLQE